MINSPFLENSGIIPITRIIFALHDKLSLSRKLRHNSDYKNNFRQKLHTSTVESGFEGHFWINVASFTKLLTIKVKSSMYKHKSKVEGLRLLQSELKIPKLGCDQIFTLPASSLLLVSSFTLVGLEDSNSFLDLSLKGVLVLQHGCSERLLALDQHSLLRRRGSSWGHHLARHHLWVELSWRVPGSGSVFEALLGSDLLGSHGDWGHARPGHHGHGLRAGLTHGGAGSSCHAGTGAWSSGHTHAWHTTGAWDCLLLGPSWLGSDLGRGEESLGLGHGGHEVSPHPHLLHATHLLHAHACHALDVLTGQVCFTVLLPLSQGHVERLGHDNAAIHLSHGLGSFLGGGEAHEPKSLRATLLVHHLSRSDSSVRGELLPQSLIINGVIQILHIQVDPLVPVQPLELQLLELLLKLLLPLGLLLSPTHIEGLPEHLNTVKFINCLLSRLRILERHKSKTFVLSRLISHDLSAFSMLGEILLLHHFVRGDLSELGEDFLQLFVSQIFSEVLDVDIGELLGLLSQLLLALLAGNKSADKHLLFVQQHAVDLLNGVHSRLLGLKMDKSITLAATISILGDLAGEDVSEGGEGVVHRLVVNGLVQVLNEDVADTRPPERWVTLAPHDPDGATLQDIEIHRVKSSFGIGRLLEVDVGVSKRPPGDHVPADPDGQHRARGGELLEEHGLGDLWGQVPHVEAGHGVVRARLLGGRWCSLHCHFSL